MKTIWIKPLLALLLTSPLTGYGRSALTHPATSMTAEELYHLSLREKTIAKTIEALPDVFKSNFTLVYNSASLQGSTFQHPRALLFNEDASFILTFNGHPEHRGYNNLEAVQFIKDEARWEFYDINFEGDQPQLSQPNPTKCLACHQHPTRTKVDPRPNWEPYNIWPTLYGSLGGSLKPRQADSADNYYHIAKLTNIETHRPGYLIEQNQEAYQLECFIKRQVMGLDDPCAPNSHSSNDRYKNLSLDLQNQTREINNGLHDLSRNLAINNFARVFRLMTEEPYYESVKYALGAFLLNRARSRAEPATYFDFTDPKCVSPLSEENMNKLLSAHEEWQLPMAGYYQPLSASDLLLKDDRLNVTRFIDLLFGPRVGQEFMDWSMDFRTGGKFLYANQRRFRASGDAAGFFAQVFFAEETHMASMSCEEIAAEANLRLSEGFSLGLLDSQ